MSAMSPNGSSYPVLEPQAPAGDNPQWDKEYIGTGLRVPHVINRVIRVTAPAAGVEWTRVVDPGTFWVVNSIRFRYVADANVANRFPGISFTDGTSEFFRVGTGTAQPAGFTFEYCFSNAFATTFGAGQMVNAPLPPYPFVLLGGMSITSVAVAIQVGDTYANIALSVYEISAEPLSTEFLDYVREQGLLSKVIF